MKKIIVACFLAIITNLLFAQKVQNLGRSINSQYDEREPVLSHDGKTLYFWRRDMPSNMGGLDDFGDIWFSKLLSPGVWAQPVRMAPPLNSTGQDFVWQVGSRNDTLWLAQIPGGRKIPGTAYATRNRLGYWNTPIQVKIRGLVSEGLSKDYRITPDGKLLLTNKGADTYGESDLYVCFPINDTTWSTPINLGPRINTRNDEDAPFLAADGVTLYFNSNGHPDNKGNHDIYMSRRLDNTWKNWSKPVNLGSPINTEGYDYDFTLSKDGLHAFWCSDVGTIGKGDILYLNMADCPIDIYPSGSYTLCEGDTLRLEAGYVADAFASYQWLKDGQKINGAIQRTYTITSAGSYRLMRKQGNCTATSEPVKVNYVPGVEASISSPKDFLCEGDSIFLWSGRKENYTYQWEKNGMIIPDAILPGYWVHKKGIYRVKISNGQCAQTSAPYEIKSIPQPEIFLAGNISAKSATSLPKWMWANRDPQINGQVGIQDVAIDTKGSIVMLGTIKDKGTSKRLIQKYYAAGPLAFTFTGNKSSCVNCKELIETDPDDHIIVAGEEHFLTKYRPDGRQVWQLEDKMGSISGLAVDPVGNIYSLILQDAGKSGSNKRGGYLLLKHNTFGELLWMKNIPADLVPGTINNSLYADENGDVYLAGNFDLIANFEDQVLRANLTKSNFFVSKFNRDGEFIWATHIAVEKESSSPQSFFVEPDGKTFLLTGNVLYQMEPNGGKIIKNDKLNFPAILSKANLLSDKGYRYISALTDKREPIILKLNNPSQPIVLWQGLPAAKSIMNSPTMAVDPSGSLAIASESDGKFPGKILSPGKPLEWFVAQYAQPETDDNYKPIKICDQKSITLFAREIRGVTYQWLKDGKIVEGATGNVLQVNSPGSYQVMVLGASCDNSSPAQLVIPCDSDPLPVTTLASNENKPILPAPPKADIPVSKSRDVEEMKRNEGGEPILLSYRQIEKQADVVIQNRKVSISIWDHEQYDQDTVSININGQWIIQNYGLQLNKYTFEYTFDERNSHNFIILYAKNLGIKPPNTASIMIDDGIKPRIIRLRSTLENCGMLNLKLN